MLFGKKSQQYLETMRQNMEEELAELKREVCRLGENMNHLGERTEQTAAVGTDQIVAMGELRKTVDHCSRQIGSQGISLEDMLEVLEKQQEQKSLEQEKIRSLEDDRSRLLEVLECYQTFMWQIRTAPSLQDVSWQEQFLAWDHVLLPRLETAGLAAIDETGVPASYEKHEVIAVEATADENRHGMVCKVLKPGYMDHGTVLQKARVTAWKYELQDELQDKSQDKNVTV